MKTKSLHLLELQPNQVVPDPFNEREEIDFERAEGYAESMRTIGFLPDQAVKVRRIPVEKWRADLEASPRKNNYRWMQSVKPDSIPTTGDIYQIVDGEHRLHAARMAGIPVLAHEFHGTDDQAKTLQMIANTGKPWTPREWMAFVKKQVDKGLGVEEVRKLTGKRLAWVEARVEIAKLPSAVIKELAPYATVTALRQLAALYDLAGNTPNFKTREDVDIVTRDIALRFSDSDRSNQWLLDQIAQWEKDSRQFQLWGGSPIPSEEDIRLRETGRTISRFRDNVAELTFQLKHELDLYQSENPDGDLSAFIAKAARRSNTSIAHLLDRLGAAQNATRALLCRLCASGEEAAACTVCENIDPNDPDAIEKAGRKKKKRKKPTPKAPASCASGIVIAFKDGEELREVAVSMVPPGERYAGFTSEEKRDLYRIAFSFAKGAVAIDEEKVCAGVSYANGKAWPGKWKFVRSPQGRYALVKQV